MNAKGIQHICTAPYHPASNGAIERFIQIFKQAMRLEREMVCLSSTVYRTFLCYIGAHHTQLLVRYAGNKHGRSNIMMPEQVSDSLQLAPVMVREGRDKSVWKPGTILEHWYLIWSDGWGADAMEACGSHLRSFCSICSDCIRVAIGSIIYQYYNMFQRCGDS